MRWLKAASLLAVTTVAATAVTVSPAASAAPAPASVRSFWLHLDSSPVSDEVVRTEAKRRSYVVLNAWEGSLAAKLKRANPAVQVFVYKDLSSTRSYACRSGVDDRDLPAGIGYCDADRNHPEWFLKDANGKRLEYSGYAGHWQMDVGDPAYQKAWADSVVAGSKSAGFDGVFMDNALFPCDAYHDGVCPAKYRTDSSFQDAYKSMLANTRGSFTSAGLKTVANLSNARLHDGAWNAYTEHLDGGFDEWWLTFGDTNLLSEYPEGWSRQVAEITAAEQRGKLAWVQPHFSAGADQPFRYTLASYLLATGKTSAIAELARTDRYDDPSPWHPEYDWNLGTPSGPYRSVGTNVFRRDFACGTVLVNANRTGSSAVTVRLGGSYADAKGSSVTSVSLPGTSGAILRKSC
ncbi:putative glycoside hydrolase family 15 protein [Actinosynnema sp. NPDC050436]|uniref:putative glycoside hydrolase family 15 protein n=1 Tax=Actinosynnema sp. NPDC050436 TaxID=3155659 RepID=UPI0033F17218